MGAIIHAEFDALLHKLVGSFDAVSDVLLVPGRLPQVEVHGVLESPSVGEPVLTGERVEAFADVIIGGNAKLNQDFEKTGACDCSYALEDKCRFRVNIYRQNGRHAVAMRRLNSEIPSIELLKLPAVFKKLVQEKPGLVFITGGTGNGKTTTLAALLNEVNTTESVHIVTLEDPIEYLHAPKKSTFSHRELGRDFFSFPDGLRSALRQAPKVILVGEVRDRETMEIAMTAGETGHLVFATLHTNSADQTIHRILGFFTKDEEQLVRERLAGSLRFIVGQRLVPKKGGGRYLVTELMGSSLRTREAIELGENETRRLHEIIEAGQAIGWHSFEQSLLKAYEAGCITEDTAMTYSIHKPVMRQRLDISRGLALRTVHTTPQAPMMVVEAAEVASLPPANEPLRVVKPPPPSFVKGVLNSFL
jgi:twitching motility protein PilT